MQSTLIIIQYNIQIVDSQNEQIQIVDLQNEQNNKYYYAWKAAGIC